MVRRCRKEPQTNGNKPMEGLVTDKVERRKVRSGYLPFRTNASTLPITPKRSSSHDVDTSSYRYHTTTYSPTSVSTNRRTNHAISVASMVWFISRPGLPMKEGRFVLGTFRSERMRVLYRSRQNDRLRVMLVPVHIDITPPQVQLEEDQRVSLGLQMVVQP
ncbi:hypothetical protein TNCV_4434751 [Trichonephila clavipes]|nr:hypothetical protein TNCV_4434751 [Trichonephila clavipes]